MSKLIINGGKPLSGEIEVVGAKNHILKVMPLALMMKGESVFTNVPDIDDVVRISDLLSSLGAQIKKEGRVITVNTDHLTSNTLVENPHKRLRSSIMIPGPALHRMGEVTINYPGGCVLGKRPIDLFIDGFKKFGVEVTETTEKLVLKKPKKLQAAKIVFPRVSHTATEAMITFATLVPGTSQIINAACEPEVVTLAEYLNSCGAKITGAGTPFVTIEGVNELHASICTIIPDRLEAGSFAIMAAATQSNITVKSINPDHLDVLWEYMRKVGADFTLGKDFITVRPAKLKSNNLQVTTHEYPGFATDLQPPFTLLMTQSEGKALIHETIYEGRLFYTDMLNQMGADILMCDPHRVLVSGKTELIGKKLVSPDLRAGITLVIAGLIASGTTEIDNIHHIDRGYENLTERLKALGADISRTD